MIGWPDGKRKSPHSKFRLVKYFDTLTGTLRECIDRPRASFALPVARRWRHKIFYSSCSVDAKNIFSSIAVVYLVKK